MILITMCFLAVPDSPIKKIKLGMSHDAHSGGYDQSLRICTAVPEKCCNVHIGGTTSGYAYERDVDEQCGDLLVHMATRLTAELTSTSSNQFKPEYLQIRLANEAMFGFIWNKFFSLTTGPTRPTLAFPGKYFCPAV